MSEPTEDIAVPNIMEDFVVSLTSDEHTPAAPETPTEPEVTPETPAEPETPEVDPLTLDTPEIETPEAPPAEEEIPDKPKNRADWDTLRASRDRHKQTAEEAAQNLQRIQAEAEELRVKAARAAELEEKLKTFDEYEKELAVTRLEATREYKETIKEPLDTIGASATIIAETNGADADKVLDILAEKDPAKQRAAFKELTAGWDNVDSAELWAMTKDARVLFDKQDLMKQNASAAAKEQQALAAAREAAQKDGFRKEFTNGTKDVVKSLKEKTPFIPLAEGETADDRYTNLESKVAAVDFDAQSPRAKAFAAAAAIEYPRMVQVIQKLQEENATLLGRVKANNSSKAAVTPAEGAAHADTEEDFLKAMGVPVGGLQVFGV